MKKQLEAMDILVAVVTLLAATALILSALADVHVVQGAEAAESGLPGLLAWALVYQP